MSRTLASLHHLAGLLFTIRTRLPWPVRVSVFNSEDYALIFTKTPAGTTSRLSSLDGSSVRFLDVDDSLVR